MREMESDVSKSRLQVVVPVPMCFLPVCLPATSEWAVASNAQRRGANAR